MLFDPTFSGSVGIANLFTNQLVVGMVTYPAKCLTLGIRRKEKKITSLKA